MSNNKPYKFTAEDKSNGGKASSKKRLENKLIANKMMPYFKGEYPYNEEGGKNNFVNDLDDLTPKERLQFTSSILQFLLPKLSQVDGQSLIDISGNLEISSEERKERIMELAKKIA